MIKFTTIFLILISLCGCISLTDATPPPTLYLLNASENQTQTVYPFSITVTQPQVKSGLDTDRIALMTNQRRILNYYAEARWNGRLEDILKDFAIETLESYFNSVSISETFIDEKADFKFVMSVRDFQAEYPDGDVEKVPTLRISMSVSILNLHDNKVVANFQLKEEAVAASNSLTDVTKGLELLLQDLFLKIPSNLDGKL